MEEVLMQGQTTAMDKVSNVVLDIESLSQVPEKCSGSPAMTKALSRKGSSRMERRNSEDQDADGTSKKLLVKVVGSQMEFLKQPLAQNKALVSESNANNSTILTDAGDGRSKRFHRLTSIHPRQILLAFATVSSMGTLILIYFTLAIKRKVGD